MSAEAKEPRCCGAESASPLIEVNEVRFIVGVEPLAPSSARLLGGMGHEGSPDAAPLLVRCHAGVHENGVCSAVAEDVHEAN